MLYYHKSRGIPRLQFRSGNYIVISNAWLFNFFCLSKQPCKEVYLGLQYKWPLVHAKIELCFGRSCKNAWHTAFHGWGPLKAVLLLLAQQLSLTDNICTWSLFYSSIYLVMPNELEQCALLAVSLVIWVRTKQLAWFLLELMLPSKWWDFAAGSLAKREQLLPLHCTHKFWDIYMGWLRHLYRTFAIQILFFYIEAIC